MPPPVCTTCGKWVEQGGGVCAICRTLDRLAALIRGSSIPLSAEGVLLRALRGWLAEVQDIGEICRGVVPNPSGPQLTPGGEIRGVIGPPLPPPPNTEGLPAAPSVVTAATSKAPPPVKTETEEAALPPAVPAEEALPPAKPEPVDKRAKSEHSQDERPPLPRRTHRPRSRSRSPRSRHRKRSRRTRSRSRRRRPIKREPSPAPRTPAEGPGVETAEYYEEGEEEEHFTPDLERPRSPSRPPPPRSEVPDRRSPRPGGSRWQGPIRAYRREPPPGQGKHFGKNKGVTKRKRNKAFRDRQGRRRPRHR